MNGGVYLRCIKTDISTFSDELEEIQDDDILAEKLNDFVMKSSNLQTMWELRDFFYKLGKKQLDKFPLLWAACGTLAACEGDIKLARECVGKIEKDSAIRIFAEIEMPYTTDKELFNLANEIEKVNINTIPEITLTVGRPSIVNGYRDFSYFFTVKEEDKGKVFKLFDKLYGEERGKLIQSVIKAENLYQQNELYDALVEVTQVIPKLETMNDFRILFVALFVEIETLLMSGEIRTTAAKMEEIRHRMKDGGYDEFVHNLSALDAWTALYDGEYLRVKKWMDEEAPDENGDFSMLDLFGYFIKMRVYLLEERHLALFSLGAKLIPLLNEGHRNMDLCQVYMLIAMNEFAMGKVNSAYNNIEKALAMAEERQYDRIIADEGQRMYELLVSYENERGTTDYLKRVIEMTYQVAVNYPEYLKIQRVELSEKERIVLSMLDTKLKTQEIADKLNISVETVKTHKKRIYKKFGVKTKKEAVAEGKKAGLI